MSYSALSVRERVLIALAGMALVGMGAKNLLLDTVYNDYAAKRKIASSLAIRKTSLEQYADRVEQMRSVVASAKKRRAALERELFRAKNSLTTPDQAQAVLTLLEEAAASSRMDIVGVTSSTRRVTLYGDTAKDRRAHSAEPAMKTENHGWKVEYDKITITISIESDFRSSAGFVRKLAKAPVPLRISGVRISADPLTPRSPTVTHIELEFYTAI